MDPSAHQQMPYAPICETYIRARVLPDDQQMMLGVMDMDNVVSHLQDSPEYIGTYRVLNEGAVHFYQYKYILVPDGSHIIAGFQNVDAMITEHKEQEIRLQEAYNMAASLASEYHTIWRISGDDNTMTLVHSSGKATIAKALELGLGHADYEKMMPQYIDSYIVE